MDIFWSLIAFKKNKVDTKMKYYGCKNSSDKSIIKLIYLPQ